MCCIWGFTPNEVLYVLNMYIHDISNKFASGFEYMAKFEFSSFGCRKSLATKSRFVSLWSDWNLALSLYYSLLIVSDLFRTISFSTKSLFNRTIYSNILHKKKKKQAHPKENSAKHFLWKTHKLLNKTTVNRPPHAFNKVETQDWMTKQHVLQISTLFLPSSFQTVMLTYFHKHFLWDFSPQSLKCFFTRSVCKSNKKGKKCHVCLCGLLTKYVSSSQTLMFHNLLALFELRN